MFTRSHILKIVFFVGTVVLFISWGVFKTNASLTDVRDGKTYKTVKIGSQVWMAENLNYEYNEGTARSYCYGNDPAMCEKYGRLYPLYMGRCDGLGRRVQRDRQGLRRRQDLSCHQARPWRVSRGLAPAEYV